METKEKFPKSGVEFCEKCSGTLHVDSIYGQNLCVDCAVIGTLERLADNRVSCLEAIQMFAVFMEKSNILILDAGATLQKWMDQADRRLTALEEKINEKEEVTQPHE